MPAQSAAPWSTPSLAANTSSAAARRPTGVDRSASTSDPARSTPTTRSPPASEPTAQRGAEARRCAGDDDRPHGPGTVVSASVHELRALVDAYAVTVDERDVVAFCSLFAHDAVLSRGRRTTAASAAATRASPSSPSCPPQAGPLRPDAAPRVDAPRASRRRRGGRASPTARRTTTRATSTASATSATTTATCAPTDGWRFGTRTVRTLWTEER